MLDADRVFLKVRISRDARRRLNEFVSRRYPDFMRGPLSKEVEKAIIYYLDSKEKPEGREEVVEHTRTHGKTKQFFLSNNYNYTNAKFEKLIHEIRKYSNKETKTIFAGQAKKAIRDTFGKDERTIEKYLELLHEEDVLY